MIVLSFHESVRGMRPADAMISTFNGYVRNALRDTVQYWLVYFRSMHFGPQAARRYGHNPRSAKYAAIKRRARWIYSPRLKVKVPATFPPENLVWTGDLKRDILQRPVSAFNIRSISTSNKTEARAKIQSPHPMRSAQWYELTTVIDAEQAILREHCRAQVWAQIKMGGLIYAA